MMMILPRPPFYQSLLHRVQVSQFQKKPEIHCLQKLNNQVKNQHQIDQERGRFRKVKKLNVLTEALAIQTIPKNLNHQVNLNLIFYSVVLASVDEEKSKNKVQASGYGENEMSSPPQKANVVCMFNIFEYSILLCL